MKVAAIDLGTNSFLCLIAEVEAGKIIRVYDDQVQIVRLGQDVNKNKKFHPEALARAKKTLTDFAALIKQHQPQKILAMATSAARDVSNGAELFQIGKDLGIPIQIIPGEREAEITFKGSVSGQKSSDVPRIVIDIGGGSTEIIKGIGSEFQFGESVDIGGVRLTEMFVQNQPVEKQAQAELTEHIVMKLRPLLEKIKASGVKEAIAVAGTPTELARVDLGEFDAKKIDNYVIPIAKLKEWTEFFAKTSVEEKIKKGFHPGRADIIYVGATILYLIAKELNLSEIKVSTRGVRYGVALEMEKNP